MLSWITNLWAEPAQEQIQVIERREPSLEEHLESILSRSRGVRSHIYAEMDELIMGIDAVLQILESAVGLLESQDLDMRAKRLRTRLRKTRTRAQNTRAA